MKQNDRLFKQYHISLHIIVWTVLSVLFTSIIVQFSLSYGRLLLPAAYDDVVYFLSGLRILDTLYKEGFAAVIQNYIHHPPHSPFSTYLSVLSFGMFGIHDWAPYLSNGIIIFMLLAGVDYLLGNIPLWWKSLFFIFTLTLPFVGMTVHEFRPDLANALCTAMGIVLLISRPFFTSDVRRKLPVIICFSLALLIKPSAFPFTLIMFFSTLCLAVLSDRIITGTHIQFQHLLRHVGVYILLISILVSPYYALAIKRQILYVYRTLVTNISIWAYTGNSIQQAVFYLTGHGGNTMLGKHLYLLALIILIGAIITMKTCDKEKIVHFLSLLILMFIAWLIPTANVHKTHFMAAVFYFLYFFSAIIVFQHVFNSKTLHQYVYVKFTCIGLSVCIMIIGVAIAKWPPKYGARGSPKVEAINRVTYKLFHTLVDNAQGKSRIYFTTTGLINHDIFEYIAQKRGITKDFIYLPFDFEADSELWNKRFDQADFVIASQLGTGGLANENFPSGIIMNQSLELIRTRKDFQELASFPTHTGSKYFLFQKIISPLED